MDDDFVRVPAERPLSEKLIVYVVRPLPLLMHAVPAMRAGS
jgi:hypothetical protein